jgi:hypothetical protein
MPLMSISLRYTLPESGDRSESSGKLLGNQFQPLQQDKFFPAPWLIRALSSFGNSGDVWDGMVGPFLDQRF